MRAFTLSSLHHHDHSVCVCIPLIFCILLSFIFHLLFYQNTQLEKYDFQLSWGRSLLNVLCDVGYGYLRSCNVDCTWNFPSTDVLLLVITSIIDGQIADNVVAAMSADLSAIDTQNVLFAIELQQTRHRIELWKYLHVNLLLVFLCVPSHFFAILCGWVCVCMPHIFGMLLLAFSVCHAILWKILCWRK